ncbi:MAG: ornithine cyclodeaminase family protein [Deltaproteobacteria bacterium]|nr:ornithine cyclodeaminase family protein [Deltaproteobacteria bacterium]
MAGANQLLYLSRAQVEACGLGLGEIIDALEKAFVIKGQGGAELPPKPGIHPFKDSFLHAMLCYVSGVEAAGIKWVSAYPANPDKGLPTISALVILNDPQTGLPLAVMDGTWMTAWRTAGVSALTAKRLARPGARTLAICGAGVQGRTNLDALAYVLGQLKEVRVYDTEPRNLEAYLEEMAPRHPNLELKGASSAQEAVRGADVVLTAGPMLKNPQPVIEDEWLAPGSLGLPLDFDSYFAPSAFLGCDKFFTDDVEQIRYYQTIGYFSQLPDINGDLGDLAIGQVAGRESEEERIIGCNLGLALDDMVVGLLLLQRAREKGLGLSLDL